MTKILCVLVLLMVLALPISTLAQVPLVTPQQPRPDGSLVHVAQDGDTIDGIVIAYAHYSVTLERLKVFNGWRFPPDFVRIGESILIFPPGSFDPQTGQLLVNAAILPTSTPTTTNTPIPLTQTATEIIPNTETPTPSPSATLTLTSTTEPPTSTPTEIAAKALQATEIPPTPAPSQTTPELSIKTGTLCVGIYDDADQNGYQDPQESLLTGGIVRVNDSETNLSDTPLCLENIPAGQVMMNLTAPEGYGLTRSGNLLVTVAAGQTTQVRVGAAAGFIPPSPPSPANETLTAPVPDTMRAANIQPLDKTEPKTAADYLGFIPFTLALLVLFGGIFLGLWLRYVPI